MSRQIKSSRSIPSLVGDAFRVATEERPGPVHLELAEGHCRGKPHARDPAGIQQGRRLARGVKSVVD